MIITFIHFYNCWILLLKGDWKPFRGSVTSYLYDFFAVYYVHVIYLS